MTSLRAHASCSGVALVTLACFALATSGCLSNEYVISRDELIRVASLPPEARGHAVRVSQQLGERRAEALDVAIPRYEDDEAFSSGGNVSIDVGNAGGGGPSGGRVAGSSGGFRGGPVSSGFHGTPPGGGGFHGTPPAGMHASAGGGFHGVPAPKGGGGGLSLGGGGGGGGNGGDALLMLVVVAIIGATIATVVLAASEGARFEGHAELSPEQPLYLETATGTLPVALGDLTMQEAVAADSAVVKDDEGFGLSRLDHAPLDRKGALFRFELGAGTFSLGGTHASGLASHIQAGFYPTHTLGLVFDFGIATGTPDPCCVGLPVPTDTMTRLSFGLEAQAFPIGLGPLHLGGFAGGGIATAGSGGAYESGPLASGGALLELDLTSHMALTVRAGASGAWLPSGFSSAGTLTGGLTIY